MTSANLKSRFKYHKSLAAKQTSSLAWFVLMALIFLIAWAFIAMFSALISPTVVYVGLALLLFQSFFGFPKTYICINHDERLIHREIVLRGKVLSRGRFIPLADFDFMYADFQETEGGGGAWGFIKLFSRKRSEFDLRRVDGSVADLWAEMGKLSIDLQIPSKDYTRLM